MVHYAAGFNPLLRPRECVHCSDQAPVCNCSAGFDCVLTAQTCDACSVAQCQAPSSSTSSGVSSGAVGGAVAAVLIFLFFIVGGFLAWRRRAARRRQAAFSREKAAATPNPHSSLVPGARLSRTPNLMEKGPSAPEDANPFEGSGSGAASIVSGGFSAHSIPIGLAPESSPSSPTHTSPTSPTFTLNGVPIRPARPQDLDIRNNANPVRPSSSNLEIPRPNYAPSSRSGLTVSTMDSTASSAMEGLYESPTIVSAVQRTVIGAGKAEAVPVNGLGTPNSPRLLSGATSAPLRRSQPGPSPLGMTHFAKTLHNIEEDPFADTDSIRSGSTNMSFGMGTPAASLRSVQATTTTANRVTISSLARSATLRSLGQKTTLGGSAVPSEEGHGSKQPRASEVSGLSYPPTRRTSMESLASNSDSVLASFPFVPPSPLQASSSRSPLSVVFTTRDVNRQSTTSTISPFGHAPEDITAPPPLPTNDLSAYRDSAFSSSSTLPGPSRPFATSSMEHRVSTMSAASEGLGEFDFQFGSAPSTSGHGHSVDEPTFGSMGSSNAPVSVAQLRSDSMALPVSERIALANSVAGSPPLRSQQSPRKPRPDDDVESTRSYATLDARDLSRDLAANRLPY